MKLLNSLVKKLGGRPCHGFSLAEVTLAVGITSVGMLALIGLIPGGLDSMRQSSAKVAEAKIIQAVTADYQMGDWGSRTTGQALTNKEYYFDERGVEVKDTDIWKHYTVRVTVDPVLVSLQGDTAGNQYLRRLQIQVTDRPDPAAAFEDPAQHRSYGSTVALIEQTNSNVAIKY
jgi:uncharacterized protein (TIGR02598 family)